MRKNSSASGSRISNNMKLINNNMLLDPSEKSFPFSYPNMLFRISINQINQINSENILSIFAPTSNNNWELIKQKQDHHSRFDTSNNNDLFSKLNWCAYPESNLNAIRGINFQNNKNKNTLLEQDQKCEVVSEKVIDQKINKSKKLHTIKLNNNFVKNSRNSNRNYNEQNSPKYPQETQITKENKGVSTDMIHTVNPSSVEPVTLSPSYFPETQRYSDKRLSTPQIISARNFKRVDSDKTFRENENYHNGERKTNKIRTNYIPISEEKININQQRISLGELVLLQSRKEKRDFEDNIQISQEKHQLQILKKFTNIKPFNKSTENTKKITTKDKIISRTKLNFKYHLYKRGKSAQEKHKQFQKQLLKIPPEMRIHYDFLRKN